ncbi:hypothetical protein H7X68_00620 [Candidatus Saccharibacteria bacterium]|nr:hypothetical protein [Candidatus Saccharibacteria bacterium]
MFLKINSIWLSIVASLFFTINPIFLGNVSKIGLVLAAAMLPLCLVAIQKVFEKQQLRYLLLWIALLNISLIHPFTMTVNLLVSGGYLLYKAYNNRPFIAQNLPKLLLVGLVGLLLNAYFLLPIASIGSVSKDVLSSNVDAAPTDYTSLIDVANTGDIFTGMSLAKGVLKDYEFYNNSTQALYFLGIFTFYVILFGMYVRVEKNLDVAHRKYFAWALASFLLLLLLAAVNYLFVKDLIKLIVGLPGGWIFRSPLKWQLYIPFAIATMLVLVMAYVPRKSHKIALYSGLAISFLLMNSFISAEVYNKLLTPREISYFGSLQQADLNQKNILIVNDESCFSFASEHSAVMTELNQILTSKNVQVNQISLDTADTINLSAYDYVLGCQNTAAKTLQGYDFNMQDTFVDDAFQLYANKRPKAYVYSNQKVFALEKPQQIGNKYQLATSTLGTEFDFTDAPTTNKSTTTGLQNAYENMTFKDMNGSSINTSLSSPPNSGKQTLYLKNSDNLNYKLTDNQLSLTPEQQPEYQPLSQNNETKVLEIPRTEKLTVNYNDPKYDSKNIFPNPSLEQGPWQPKVSDCYAYGDDPKINMDMIKDDKSNGVQALQLGAQNHVACTGPNDIPVQPEQNYLLSFDYKSLNGRFAAYHISFDDEANTSYFKRLDNTEGDWSAVTKNITAPPGARNLKILVYAYPDTSGINDGLARYDNFQLTATPNIQNHFYLISEPKKVLQQPKKVSFEVANPTKTTIHVQGASSPFYLETKESYNPRWSLSVDGGEKLSVPDEDHVKINNYMNGWLVDPSKLCQSSCTKNSDGSYDITLVMEFVPQRWLYIGATISTLTLVVTIGYFIYISRYARKPQKYVMRRDLS